jgi:hypothetical protein
MAGKFILADHQSTTLDFQPSFGNITSEFDLGTNMYSPMSPMGNTGLDNYSMPKGEFSSWQDWSFSNVAMEHATPVRLPYTDGIAKNMLLTLRHHNQAEGEKASGSFSHEVARRAIEVFMLPRHQGELEEWVKKLFGPSDVESFNHLVGFVIYFASNNLLQRRYENRGLIGQVIDWLMSKTTCSLRTLLSMRVPAVQACIQCFRIPGPMSIL